MKNNHIIGLILILVPFITGCDDFLDEAPRGNAIAETVDDYDMMFNAGQGNQIFNMQFFDQYYAQWKSDDMVYTDGSITSIGLTCTFPTTVESAIKYEDKIYRDDETTPECEKCYNMIYTYNVIANGVMDADGSDIEKKQLLAEARVSRAYMHFLLAQWYAMPYSDANASSKALPIITEANTQQMDFTPVSVKDYYQWIVKEMEEACPDLKERTEHRMRCYKATGYALLGKVYFFMNDYDKALQHLRTAYNLLKGDANVYLTNHNSKQAQYGYKELNMSQLMSYVPYPYRDNEVLFCKCSAGMKHYYPAWYGYAPTDFLKPEVFNLFTENDLRRNLMCTKDASGNPYPYATACFVGVMINVGITLPEVYLMLAESEARVGQESNARSVLKEFRSTRMLPGYEDVPENIQSKNNLIKFCFDEESREFAGTGYRFYTVRRLWNDPLFQDQKPISHIVGNQTYTMQENQLKTSLPETILIWNENMR